MNIARIAGTASVALAVLGADAADVREAVPVYEADFSAAVTNVEIINYEGRTPPSYRTIKGRPVVAFNHVPNGKKKDTMWGVKTKPFAVTSGDEYFALIEMAGDIPKGQGRPGAFIGWYGADGKRLMTQDAKGKKVSMADRLRTPLLRRNRGKSLAYTRGVVPAGAVRAEISHQIDGPDLKTNQTVVICRVAYYEHPQGEPYGIDDIAAPTLEMLTKSPSSDFSEPLRFRVTDASGVDWAETSIRVDGQQVAVSEFRREGDAFVFAPTNVWERDSIHRVEIDAVDTKGNGGYDCGFVAFTERKRTHPVATIRDDGMMLVEGKPVFPLGWARVRPCSGNGYSITQGIADMKANGMNIAHTYLVRGMGPKRDQELFDELVAACEKYGVILHAEPADRKPHGPNYLKLTGDNLLRGLGYRMPVLWGIGDDTSMLLSPDELKYIYRSCKAFDPEALTISADVATGPGGVTPYLPYADILCLESYPLCAAAPEDNEMAKAAENLDNACDATYAAKIPGRSVFCLPQAFKGWGSWLRLPTIEEIRCQAYLAIAGRARGLVYYASCGDPGQDNRPPPPGEKEKLPKNIGPLNIPGLKDQFYAMTREIAALMPSLVTRDAKVQPKVRIVRGEANNGLGLPAIRCLLKEDGLLVAANSSHLPVTAEIVLPDGRKVVHEFARNGVLVVSASGEILVK